MALKLIIGNRCVTTTRRPHGQANRACADRSQYDDRSLAPSGDHGFSILN